MTGDSELKTRVLVVDDSAYNRQTLTAMLETLPGVEVVGRAVGQRHLHEAVFHFRVGSPVGPTVGISGGG